MPSVTSRNKSAPTGENGHVADERHAEQSLAHDDDDEEVQRREQEVGRDLAEDHVPGPERHDRKLLDRPGLPLPHDAEARDQSADEHQDQARQTRDHDPRRLELRVEQDPDRDRRGQRAPRLSGHGHASESAFGGLRGEELGPVHEHKERALPCHETYGRVSVAEP
jgi:hypothetical protein